MQLLHCPQFKSTPRIDVRPGVGQRNSGFCSLICDSRDHAFSRYEDGKTKPPLGLVKLLKVLDHHPELLDEIKVA